MKTRNGTYNQCSERSVKNLTQSRSRSLRKKGTHSRSCDRTFNFFFYFILMNHLPKFCINGTFSKYIRYILLYV
jgi:hypothetical protein